MSRYFNQSKVAVVAVWIAAMMMIYNRFTNSLNYERMLQVIEQTLLQESSPEDLGAFTKSSHAAISGLFKSNLVLAIHVSNRARAAFRLHPFTSILRTLSLRTKRYDE